jgi:hypothetical protein
MKRIFNLPKNFVLFLIRIYQKFLSFDHSFWARPEIYRVCIHYPSCSQYTYESISKFGLIKGVIMGFFRVLRCNPFSGGGHDPVPDHFTIRSNSKGSDHTNH